MYRSRRGSAGDGGAGRERRRRERAVRSDSSEESESDKGSEFPSDDEGQERDEEEEEEGEGGEVQGVICTHPSLRGMAHVWPVRVLLTGKCRGRRRRLRAAHCGSLTRTRSPGRPSRSMPSPKVRAY